MTRSVGGKTSWTELSEEMSLKVISKLRPKRPGRLKHDDPSSFSTRLDLESSRRHSSECVSEVFPEIFFLKRQDPL